MMLPCLSQLANFTCRACGLSGTIAPSWWSISLQQLLLPNNAFSGGLSGSTVANKSRLQVLDLSYNQLDQLPAASFWNATAFGLQRLHLQGNAFPMAPLSGK